MDAVDVLKVCLRRWYVMLPILLGAAGVSYQLVQAQETTYTAWSSYGLVQPGLAAGPQTDADTNPLGPGGNLLLGEALEAQLNSRETQAVLGSDETRGWGPGEAVNYRSYIVRIPQNETTYEVRTWGEDEREVREVVDGVVAAAPDIADSAQDRAGVPTAQRYEPFVFAPTQVEELPSTSGLKLAIAVMGVGLLMGAAWSIVTDRVVRWRRTVRAGAGPVGRGVGVRDDARGSAAPEEHRRRTAAPAAGPDPEADAAPAAAEPARHR
jgi:hypothetical protein